MINQVTVPEIDSLTLDSVFPAPGRNDPCHCGSGIKYKRCCSSKDERAWRAVSQFLKEADAACAMVRPLPDHLEE